MTHCSFVFCRFKFFDLNFSYYKFSLCFVINGSSEGIRRSQSYTLIKNIVMLDLYKGKAQNRFMKNKTPVSLEAGWLRKLRRKLNTFPSKMLPKRKLTHTNFQSTTAPSTSRGGTPHFSPLVSKDAQSNGSVQISQILRKTTMH